MSKFRDHDLIFLGEYHRIQHDPLLVQSLIPLLYRNGIRTLGIEFAINTDQDRIDSLLLAESFDETLARHIIWDFWPWWGFQEYIDIFRVAWQVNRERPTGTLPFRIVGLNGRQDWSHTAKVFTLDEYCDGWIYQKPLS